MTDIKRRSSTSPLTRLPSLKPKQLLLFEEDERPLSWLCGVCCKLIEDSGVVEVISGGAFGSYPYPHFNQPHTVHAFHYRCFPAVENRQLPISPGCEIECDNLRTIADAEAMIHHLCAKAWFHAADERAFRNAVLMALKTASGRRKI